MSSTFWHEVQIAISTAILLAALTIYVMSIIGGLVIYGRYIGLPIARAILGIEQGHNIQTMFSATDKNRDQDPSEVRGMTGQTPQSHGAASSVACFALCLMLEFLFKGLVGGEIEAAEASSSLIHYVFVLLTRASIETMVIIASVSALILLVGNMQRWF